MKRLLSVLIVFTILFGCKKEETTPSISGGSSSKIDTTKYFISLNDGVNPEIVCTDHWEWTLQDSTLMYSQLYYSNGDDSVIIVSTYFRFQNPLDASTVVSILNTKDPIFYEVIFSLLNGWTAVGMYIDISVSGQTDEYVHVRRDTINSHFNISQVKFDSTAVFQQPHLSWNANIFGVRGSYQCKTFLYDDTTKHTTFYGRYHLPMAYEVP